MFDFDILESIYEEVEKSSDGQKLNGGQLAPKENQQQSNVQVASEEDHQLCADRAASEGLAKLRIWAISDVHSDYRPNLEWVRSFTSHGNLYRNDCLIVAGDVTHRADLLKDTLCLFKKVFKYVFFVPGNHDLWKHGDACVDSLDKLHHILAVCDEIGVLTRPTELPLGRGTKSVLVVPILSWHHQAFDTEPELSAKWSGIQAADKVLNDSSLCSWPAGLSQLDDTVAEHLDAENEALWVGSVLEGGTLSADLRKESYDAVISFSHFLPRIELCPEKRFLSYPNLLKAVGSQFLGRRVAQLCPDIHVFGHTHFGWDMELDGTRFVQAPLSYVTERKQRIATIAVGDFIPGTEEDAPMPFMVWPQDRDAPKSQGACWSSFYTYYGRRPHEVDILPNYASMGLTWKGGGNRLSGWGGQAPVTAFADNAQFLKVFIERIKREAPTESLEKLGGDFQKLYAEELLACLQKRQTFLFDVRPVDQFKSKHALNAVSVPLADLPQLALLLPKSRRLGIYERMTHPKALKIVYGRDSSDSLAGVQLLRRLAGERSTNFAYILGGIETCHSAGMTIVSGIKDDFKIGLGHLQ